MRLDLEASTATPPVLDEASFEQLDSYRNVARLFKRGVFAAQSGDRDAARKLFTQVVALDPENEDAWMWLASISDYPEELMIFLSRVLAINPDNERAIEWHAATTSLMAKTFVKRAIAAHEEGDADFADKCIEHALAHDVNCVEAWMWRASIVSDEAEQIECLERVLEIDPQNVDAAGAIQQIEHRREEERRLEEERHLEEERQAAEAARREEERRLEETRLEEERCAEQARLAEEQRIAALFDASKSAALAGENAKALVLVHAYLEYQADNVEAWVFCSHLSHTVDEKLASLEKALALDPDNAAAKSGHIFLSSMAATTNPAQTSDIRVDQVEDQHEIDDPCPKGKMILVVDDSATVRKLISSKLEKSGHNVVCAADGVEALERMSEYVPDLVLLDIAIPRMDGYEVCRQIRANPGSSNVPVVMISSRDGFFDKVRGETAGATGHVTKPFGPETLMRTLETYLVPDAPAVVLDLEPELEPVV